MWIRCQNRMMLIKGASHINAIKEDSKYSIYEMTTECNYELGIYSSKEKALLVLDMIEKVAMYPGNTLFQMPDDDEVEV